MLKTPGLWQHLFHIRIGTMLVIVAGSALVIQAWKYRNENADADRAMTSLHIRRLDDSWPGRSAGAAHALGEVHGPDMRRVVPALLGALGDENPTTRSAAASSLGSVIGNNAEALNGDVALEVAAATKGLLSVLEDKAPDVRAGAVQALAAIQVEKKPGRTLASGVSLPPYGPVGSDRRLVMPALIRALHDSDPQVRRAACMTLNAFADAETDAPEELAGALTSDENLEVRAMAAIALVSRWRDRDQHFVAVVERLPRVTGEERVKLLFALQFATRVSGPPPVEAVPGLLAALDLEGPTIDRVIPNLINQVGPAARRELPALTVRARTELLEPESGPPDRGSALLLGRPRLRHGRGLPIVVTVVTLAPESPEAQSLIPALIKIVKGEQDGGRTDDAMAALARFGPHARAAMPLLREALEAPSPKIRSRAKSILDQLAVDDDHDPEQPSPDSLEAGGEPKCTA